MHRPWLRAVDYFSHQRGTDDIKCDADNQFCELHQVCRVGRSPERLYTFPPTQDSSRVIISPKESEKISRFDPGAGPTLVDRTSDNSCRSNSRQRRTASVSAPRAWPCTRSCTPWASTTSTRAPTGTSTSRSSGRTCARGCTKTLSSRMMTSPRETLTMTMIHWCIMGLTPSGK